MLKFEREFIQLTDQAAFKTAGDWLKSCVKPCSYVESEDGLIIHGDVDVKYIHTQLPINIARVHGKFETSNDSNELKTLKNCPKYVSKIYEVKNYSFDDLSDGPIGVQSLYVKTLNSFKFLPKQCERFSLWQDIPPKFLLNVLLIENLSMFSAGSALMEPYWAHVIHDAVKDKTPIYEVAAILIEQGYSDDVVCV